MSDSDKTAQEERWLRLRQAIQQQWPVLTDEDLDGTNGDPMAIEGLLEMKVGAAPYIAHADLEQLMAKVAAAA
jgi:hypothetical protein